MSRLIVILLSVNTLVLLASVGVNYYLLSSLAGQQPAVLTPAQQLQGEAPRATRDSSELQFHGVEKIVVNLRGNNREHYFVIDLVLQADKQVEAARLAQIDPMIRNSVVAHLSTLAFTELREMPIGELQGVLQQVIQDDFAARGLRPPFDAVMVSKMLVQ